MAYGIKLKNWGRVVAIDPHQGNPEHQKENIQFNSLVQFKKNISTFHLEDQVDLRVMTSKEASQKWKGEPVGLLWIDGNHDYKCVREDYESWETFLIPNGIIAFHDAGLKASWPGPRRMVEELEQTGKLEPFQYVHGIAWTRKR